MSTRNPRPAPPPRVPRPRPFDAHPDPIGDPDLARQVGERARRFALGLFAAIVAARAYWPSEDADKGTGMGWVAAILGLVGLGLVGLMLEGRSRLRFSAVDAGAIALMALVALSTGRAPDRRPAINLAWEWGGLAFAYLLARNLPRTRGESAALAGVLGATAAAVAVFGIYQIRVELPADRDHYLADPAGTLRSLGLADDPTTRIQFESRLLGSNEAYSTFALANSLAGFLVGPIVLAIAVAIEGLRDRRDSPVARLIRLTLAAIPTLAALACLVATKSRSAYLGLAAAAAVLAWRELRRSAPRAVALGVGAALLLATLFVVAGYATGQLDIQVLTQSNKSFRYRVEYWIGTWRILTEAPGAFWRGVGPGGFGPAYLLRKLPEASEEVLDPHNLLLEVWSTAGLLAAVALLATLILALRNLLGPVRPEIVAAIPAEPTVALTPMRPSWVVVWGGLSWLAVILLGRLDPFAGGQIARWLILGAAWVGAAVLAGPLWSRVPIPAAGVGAAVLAMVVNLLAAGGIGMPAVALMLWILVAIGQNLRDDRPCGRRRFEVGRLGVAGLALAWAAFVGTFAGAIVPAWRSEAELARAREALSVTRTHPRADFDRARALTIRAIELDRLAREPWLALADLEYQFWLAPESNNDPRVWKRILLALDGALSSPRSPDIADLQRHRAAYARAIQARLNGRAEPMEEVLLRTNIARATRLASRLHPTNATLHAELADASLALGQHGEAVKAAREALRLDAITPHNDKKLGHATRARLLAQLPDWERQATSAPSPPLP